MAKLENFRHEGRHGGPVLALLNVLNLRELLDMPKDASLACWALFLPKYWNHIFFSEAEIAK